MSDLLKSNLKFHPSITAAIIILFIGGWSMLYLDIHFDIDIGWLLQCLDRFMAGGAYDTDFYETNPPLSFLIYLPAYPLYNFFGISAQIAVFITFALYITVSNAALYCLMKKADYGDELAIITISACIFISFWSAGLAFGSKDHLIFIFLTPLCFAQYIITSNKSSDSRAITTAIILGGIAICLKPHYAIVPAIFFLHRLITTHKIFKPDFLGLIALAAIYISFIYIFTPEFITVMLPEITSIYNVDKPFPISSRFNYILYAAIAAALGFFTPRQSNIRCLIFTTAALSLLCLIPYYIQMKGFHYHALPFLNFGMVALFLSIFALAKAITKYSDISLLIACSIIAILNAQFITGGKNQILTSGQFTAQPLVETIDELAWNNVYASYDFKSMLSALPYMSDLENGSRFGQLWPLYGLSQMPENSANRQRMMEYVDMIAIDMKRYKPSVITIPQYRAPNSTETNRAYLKFLMTNDNFKRNMNNYKFYDAVPFNTSLTLGKANPDKIVVHDVYVLKNSIK